MLNLAQLSKFIIMRSIFSLLILFFFCNSVLAQEISIIPKPKSIVKQAGSYVINPQTRIIISNEASRNSAEFLQEYIKTYFGYELPITNGGTGGIYIRTGTVLNDKDGYQLVVDEHSIRITGNTNTGAFYGVQSLIQLLPVTKSEALNIPAVTIADEPAFAYRGLHLDVGRHFMPVAFIKKYIDYIALHKLNFFHWHLTEDQGWRIEIKKYPQLTEVGGWRNGTIIGPYPGTGNDGLRYGGFYTQDEVKEVVAYASKRHVEVIPEIELPGHASAAIASYPFLSCFPEQSTFVSANTPWSGPREGKQVQQTWGVFDDVFCAGKESTFEFLENVISEVMPLFPSKYFHVGGDESPKKHWEKCLNCQKRIKDLNIKGDKQHAAEHYLQSYFIQRMEKFLNQHGKSLIGWDEILEGGLAPNATVMSWRGEEGGIAAAKQKHYVIMTPGGYAYFDHQQQKQDDSVTISNNRWFLPIEKVYSWKPVPDALAANEKHFIMGPQANIWTEYMKNPAKVEYMLFPRVAALSEVGWTDFGQRDFTDFKERLNKQLKLYNFWGVNYYNKK